MEGEALVEKRDLLQAGRAGEKRGLGRAEVEAPAIVCLWPLRTNLPGVASLASSPVAGGSIRSHHSVAVAERITHPLRERSSFSVT